MESGAVTHTAMVVATLPAAARELVFAIGGLPTDHEVAVLRDAAGAMAVALGVLVGAVGMARRSMLLRILPIMAVVFGLLTLVEPDSDVAMVVALLAVCVGVAVLARASLAGRNVPVPAGTAGEIERLRLLHGRAHISCFSDEEGKRSLLAGDGAIAYQVWAGGAIAVGDPLAPEPQRREALRAFLQLCSVRGWAPCLYQTDVAQRHLYREAGLRTLKFGEEAIVDIAQFRLDTPAQADVRHELARGRRAGLEVDILPRLGRSDPAWAELERLSSQWLAGHGGREMGFSLGRFGEVVDRATWYTVARDRDGRPHAFCSWLRLGSDAIALDLIRRRPDAAPGAVDLCLTAAIERARELGLGRVSLGLVPLRDSLGDAEDGRLRRWVRRRAYERGVGGYRYRSLAHFKSRFATHWESRDVVLPRGLALVLAAAALLRLHVGAPGSPAAASTGLEPEHAV